MTDLSALILAPPAPPAPKRSGKTDIELAALHRYVVVPGGKPMPGVTTVAAYADDGEGLKRGAGKLTAAIAVTEPERRLEHNSDESYQQWLGREFVKRWGAKAELGTRVHEHVLAWTQGQTVLLRRDEEPYLDAAAKFISAEVLEWGPAERYVGSRRGYGGRLDWTGRLRRFGGAWTLGDWKTGRNRRYSVLCDALQLVALARSDGFLVYDDDGWLTGYEPMPPIEHLVDVYLQDDGTYEIYETPNADGLFDLFWTFVDAYHEQKAAEKFLRQEGLL